MKAFVFISFLLFSSSVSIAQSLKIGLIADCQYCDCDYNKKWDNDYRKSISRLETSVSTFNNSPTQLTFHLGDFIDRNFSSFNTINPIYESLTMPHYHLLGNHDFNVKDSLKPQVLDQLQLTNPYYVVNKNDWTFIVLDGTDISLYNSIDIGNIQRADSIRNYYLNQGRTQALPWNGAIGNAQLDWLDKELTRADKNLKKVIVLCHFPVLPLGDANLWNDIEVIQTLEKHQSVKAYINGHHHPGNYTIQNGIHYLTLVGMVKSKNHNSFAEIELKRNKIIVKGFGLEPNRVLKF